MQLPHGTLVTTRNGPVGLKELGESIARDSLNGYLRVSVFDRSAVRESVIVYRAGKPVMAFASDDAADRRDPDLKLMGEALRKDDAIVEVCGLSEGQVKLLQDVYREFAYVPPAPPATPAPKETPRAVAREAPKAAVSRKDERPRSAPRTEPMPEIRGRFVRAESLGDPGEYAQRYPGETGHLLFLAQRDGRAEEAHIILIKGKIEAAYDGHASGPELLESLRGVPGQAEFYAVDEALLTSIIGRQAKTLAAHAAYAAEATRAAPAVETAPVAPQAIPTVRPLPVPPAHAPAVKEKPVPAIGIPAKDLLESARPPKAPARDDISRTVDEVSGGMEDDLAMVRRVERDFANHVDELLCKLELSHLRNRRKR